MRYLYKFAIFVLLIYWDEWEETSSVAENNISKWRNASQLEHQSIVEIYYVWNIDFIWIFIPNKDISEFME